MTNMLNASSAVKSSCEDTPGERDLMLTALKAASAKARLIGNQIDTVSLALRHRNINCQQALEWLRKDNLLHWVHLPEVAR